jgi:molybdopterin converting factor small subunit
MKSIQVRVQLFGAFRKYSSGSDLRFEVPPGTTVSAVRGHLGAGGGGGGEGGGGGGRREV